MGSWLIGGEGEGEGVVVVVVCPNSFVIGLTCRAIRTLVDLIGLRAL